MAAFKISIDEDLLLIRTSPSLFNRLVFFRHWSYALELPVTRIVRTEFTRRSGIPTLIVVKRSADEPEKNIVVSLAKATRQQIDFIKHALPKIIEERPRMTVIKDYMNQYLHKRPANQYID